VTPWTWLRCVLTWKALCVGGPFDGEFRSWTYTRITVSRSGRELEWHFKGMGDPSWADVGCYERDGRRFVWIDQADFPDRVRDNREKIERYMEINRIIAETTL
jgi:hypothetical protein